MTLLNRDSILTADDLPFEDVECPEWGGTVRIRTLTGTERDAFEAEVAGGEKTDYTNVRAKLIARSAIDENGERIFSDADITKLGKKSALALTRCFKVAQRLSGLTEDEVEQLAEDFDGAQSEPSTSA